MRIYGNLLEGGIDGRRCGDGRKIRNIFDIDFCNSTLRIVKYSN